MNRASAKMHRAVILAAGKSHRLDGLNLGKPKPMIEVLGKPLLAHHLERCAEVGIEEVFINLHHLPEQIREFAGDGSKWNLKITYNLESVLAGTAGGVKGFSPYLKDAPFLVIYGDNYCTFPLSEIIDAHVNACQRPAMSIVLFELDNVMGSGVAICNPDNTIQSFLEKPLPGATDSHWVNAGVCLLEPELLDLIPEGHSDFGHDVIPHLLVTGKRILGVKTKGRVHAVDTPELLRSVTIKSRL